jgi:WD40 repeat protein
MLRILPLLLVSIPVAAADPAKDRHGDPLPEGAVARLGTERFRNLDFYSGMHLLPDGKTLCAMSRSTNTLIDIATGLPSGTVPAPKGGYPQTAHALSADGSTAATSRYDGIDVWNFKTGVKILEIKRPLYSSDNTLSFSADGKYLAIGGQVDDKMKEKGVPAAVWDVPARKEIFNAKVAQNTRCFVALSGDGKTLVTWGYHNEPNLSYEKYDAEKDPNRAVQLWNVAEAKEIAGVRVNGAIAAVAISPDGKTAAASPGNGEIQLWNAANGQPTKTLIGRSRIGQTLQFSPDGATLAASADDAAIQLFETASGRSKGVTAPPISAEFIRVRSLRFTGPDRAIALVPHGGSAVIWEVPSGTRLSTDGGHHEGITSIGFSQDGKEVLSATGGGAILRWNTKGEELGTLALKIPGSNSQSTRSSNVTLFPGGKVLTCNSGNDVCVYELPSGLQKCALPADGAYSNRTLMNAARTKAVLILPPGYTNPKDKPKPFRTIAFDLDAGLKGQPLALPPGEYMATALSPDGATLVGIRRVVAEKGEPDTILTNIDAATGKVAAEAPIKVGFGAPSAVFANDGKTFLLFKGDGGVAVHDTTTLRNERELKGDARGNSAALPVFSPDGLRVAVATGGSYGAGSAVIEVFDYRSGKRTHKFQGHSQSVAALAFSPDGTLLASGSFDTTALLWDLKTPAKD